MKNKVSLSPEMLDLTRAMIDWMYFCPKKYYDMFPYSKDELRTVLENIRNKKITNKIHKKINSTNG